MSKTYRVVFTSGEIYGMVQLIARLDPARYKHATARALVEKCKVIEDQPDGTLVHYRVLGDPR